MHATEKPPKRMSISKKDTNFITKLSGRPAFRNTAKLPPSGAHSAKKVTPGMTSPSRLSAAKRELPPPTARVYAPLTQQYHTSRNPPVPTIGGHFKKAS